jgi:hypothetical protein
MEDERTPFFQQTRPNVSERDISYVTTREWLKKKTKGYPCNRPWRPIGLRDVEDPTLSRQSAHRCCQPYAPATVYS